MTVPGYYISRKIAATTIATSPIEAEVTVNFEQPLMTLKEKDQTASLIM